MFIGSADHPANSLISRPFRHGRTLPAGSNRARPAAEWNSFRPAQSSRVIEAITQHDEDRTLDQFILDVFDLFFIEVEEIAPRTCRLGSAGVLVDDFPGLKADGLTYTRDRSRALLREDLQFLTWDHPLASGALDMLLGSERGNCAFARWPDADVSALYCESVRARVRGAARAACRPVPAADSYPCCCRSSRPRGR